MMSNKDQARETLRQFKQLHTITNDTLRGLIARVENLEIAARRDADFKKKTDSQIEEFSRRLGSANDALRHLTECVESLSRWRKVVLPKNMGKFDDSLLAGDEPTAGAPAPAQDVAENATTEAGGDPPQPGTFWRNPLGNLVEVLGSAKGMVGFRICSSAVATNAMLSWFLKHYRPVRVRPVVEVEITGETLAAAEIPRDASVEYVVDTHGDLRRVADSAVWDYRGFWEDWPENTPLWDVYGAARDDVYRVLPVRSVRFEEVE